MKFRRDSHVAEEEDDWEIIPANWWCTSFMAVSWSYTPKRDPRSKTRQFQGSLFVGLSSGSKHGSLSVNSLLSSRNERRHSEEDNTLNSDLVGVKSAMDTVTGYEKDVGFYFSNFPDLGLYKKADVDLSIAVQEHELEVGKDRWKEVVEELMNGPTDSDESLEDSLIGSRGDLELSASMLSSSDLSRSEISIDSIPMPSTPRPKLLFNQVQIKEPPPPGVVDEPKDDFLQLSPIRSLNASASSFVPSLFSKSTEEPLQFASLREDPKPHSEAHSPQVSLTNFSFPSLNTFPSSVKIKKDEQGFFTEIQVEKTSKREEAGDLLPPFLQEPTQRLRARKSRTREIVDRIRSRTSPESSSLDSQNRLIAIAPKYATHSPSPIRDDGRFITPRLSMSDDGGDRPSRLSTPSCIDDEDGWIDISQPPLLDSPNNLKSKRARELLLALTRRRTDSSSSADLKDSMSSSGISSGSESRNMSISPSPSPSPLSPPLSTSIDGWIESNLVASPPELHKSVKLGQTSNKKKSSNSFQHRNHHPHHNSRASVSSSTSQHSLHPLGVNSPSYPQFSPTSSPQHLPQHQPMFSPSPVAAFPYLLSAYPTVSLASPYATNFMQVPTFPVMHTSSGGAAMIGTPYMAPALIPVRGLSGISMKSSVNAANTTSMPAASAYGAKYPPMW